MRVNLLPRLYLAGPPVMITFIARVLTWAFSRRRYLTLHFHIASLLLKSHTTTTADRSVLIRKARAEYDKYLKQLDNYDILSKAEARLYEQLKEAPDTFSTASTTDAATRRGTKIARFKEEKALKEKMAVCLDPRNVGAEIEE